MKMKFYALPIRPLITYVCVMNLRRILLLVSGTSATAAVLAACAGDWRTSLVLFGTGVAASLVVLRCAVLGNERASTSAGRAASRNAALVD